MSKGRILVTGASTGIGEATARRLVKDGFSVIATARREERLAKLAEQIGCDYFAADLTDQESVNNLVEYAYKDGELAGLVNIAGGARGADTVEEGKVNDWEVMYNINVLATLRITQPIYERMKEKGGDIVFLTSTAAQELYPGGAGYVAAKHGERFIKDGLRWEGVGSPVRLIEIRPGMVMTEEFSLNRLGSEDAAENVYRGVAEPLLAEDIADIVSWTLTRPKHVNIDTVTVRPVAQANAWVVERADDSVQDLPSSDLK
ncbi:SDR family NAD(P)-dependent oxidoreductase [Actinobaculum suis]|uniref:SDR family NAD(P)-dependent oxidoreductase n=1 Tax=Actinobaculum suis TaxID=1657 RepID=UPI00080869B1|nr:SDR family oxidoreductase [Actinobaculum suis]OCA94896.1 oxidoreductase [Actinobaculum suis]OCA95484.1 oxidoreductase [Actinobaculum suis]